MQTVEALRVSYQTKAQSWAVEITLDDGSTQRLPMPGSDQVDALVRSFDGASFIMFDAASGEIAFQHDPLNLEDLLGLDASEDEPPLRGGKKGKRRR